ncbi:hypothetical protein VTL71DRAFT_6207 [Oculimacula yallundae]|uniref:Pyruvate decarboxylase n=1 Tax=Oculimacula yallundae TaxID=86028 RepID=A0ABR4BZP7_9HELO
MSEIKIGDYLFRRLRELGIVSVFGVPGDYELALLDLVTSNDLEWKGNPNELVASYAADGYARVNGVGAFITTFGPGELSAYCGMAGQYAEFVPVVHIVGYPTVAAQNKKAIMHHSLGDGRFDMYANMAKQITADTVVISHPGTAAAEIDRALNIMMHESRPVYIGLSVDIAYATISSTPLKSPITTTLPLNDVALQEKVIAEILSRIEKASHPIIIVDGGSARHGVLPESGVNEDLPNFGGVYQGAGTYPEIQAFVERTADLVLWIGNFPSDFNTGEFTNNVAQDIIIDFQRFSVKIGDVNYNVAMKYVLGKLVEKLRQGSVPKSDSITWNPFPVQDYGSDSPLKQAFLWNSLGSFFRPGDVVIGETGTSAFGLCDSKVPKGVMIYNQTIFGSIGYATGAIVGVAQAIKESEGKWKRPILVTGEGSMQLTVQALGDLLRWNLKPIVFVLNNGGYTVERLIHGKTASYNEVALYDYSTLAQSFGPGFPSKYHGPVKTCGDLTRLLGDLEFQNAECFQLVELVLSELDAPESVIKVGAAIDKFNEAKAK